MVKPKPKTVRFKKSNGLSHANVNKVLTLFITKASNPAPKVNAQQKAYLAECSCFMRSSLAILYPDFAAKISPISVEKLLSRFIQSKCAKRSLKRSSQKRGMKGGSLSLRSATRTVTKFSIFPGIMVLIYALLITRASVDQLNKQNPFRAGRYEFLDLAKDELAKEDLLKENMMVEITRENIMRWVSEPTAQLSEMTNTLSMKAIKIVGVVTRKHTEGLEQQVRDHCLGESMTEPEIEPEILEPEPVTDVEIIPKNSWSSFKARSWSTLSGFVSSADQLADHIAKTHLNARVLFDMPGCVARVNDLKFQELMDRMRQEHARIKLDIDMWMKKGESDINLIFSLFRIAIGMILTSLGYAMYPKTRTRTGEAYNLNATVSNKNSPIQRITQMQPQLQMPHLAEHQPYVGQTYHGQPYVGQTLQQMRQEQALQNVQGMLQGPISQASQKAQRMAADARIKEDAIERARAMMEHVVNPADQVARQKIAEQRQKENAARQRQENFAELLRQTNLTANKLRRIK